MDVTRMSQRALTGWRGKVAAPVADGVARRTSIDVDQARAVIGALFFLSSLWYVVMVVRAAVRTARD